MGRFLLFFFLLFPSLLLAKPEEAKRVRVLRTGEKITVDGRLAEPAWGKAEQISNFIQFQPERGKPASFPTAVKVLFDDNYIYLGYSCEDKEPGKVIARLTKRDADLSEDDSVIVFLDTFLDKRNCYYFSTNILGTQSDGRVVENGLTIDKTWDGIWKSAGQRTEFGWTAEVAIDLGTLKFKPGEERTWGFNVGRSIPRLFEYSFWAGPLESPYKVSQFGEIRGLSLREARKKYQLIPHIISKAEEGMETEAEAGLDARLAFSQAVSANLTLNPDFATVEADQEQINLTRFELNLPEKRNFFLEGSEIYPKRISLFYSRRVGDIVGGLKVYGKSGGFEFSGLSAQAKKDEVRGEESANFTVFRFKIDILKSSTLGFLVANKLMDEKNRGTVGLDTSLYFTDTIKFTGQLAASYGDFNRDNIAFFLRPSYDSATFHIHLRYTHLGKYFGDNANAVGFIRDDNRHELDSAVTKTFWIKRDILERIDYDSNYNIYWGVDGTLRSWQIDQGLEIDLKNKFSLGIDYTAEYKLYEKDFWNNDTKFSLGYNTREWQSARLSCGFGRNYDLDFRLIEGGFNYKITPDLSLEYALTRLVFNPDPENETTWIHVVRATQYFTKDLFLKLFYQVHSAIDKKNIQVLFVYRFQPPFGLVQLAYQRGSTRFGEKGTQGHTLFLKIALML